MVDAVKLELQEWLPATLLLVQDVGIQDAFFNKMEGHFLGPLHTLSYARVGANHFVVPVYTSHILVVIINKL